MISKYVWIGLAVGLFFVGLGVGYTVFINTYNTYAMMGNPTMSMSDTEGKNIITKNIKNENQNLISIQN